MMFGVIEIHQLTKKSRTNLWSTLSWAKVDPKKGYKLFLYVHDLIIPSKRLWLRETEKTKADKKI